MFFVNGCNNYFSLRLLQLVTNFVILSIKIRAQFNKTDEMKMQFSKLKTCVQNIFNVIKDRNLLFKIIKFLLNSGPTRNGPYWKLVSSNSIRFIEETILGATPCRSLNTQKQTSFNTKNKLTSKNLFILKGIHLQNSNRNSTYFKTKNIWNYCIQYGYLYILKAIYRNFIHSKSIA